jgi:hypothetical protein
MKNYLFGYGSLICKASRAITGQSEKAIPARAKGVKRGWYFKAPEGCTAVTAIYDKNSICNGIIIEVDEKELPKFDIREEGYSRVLIEKENIETLNKENIDGKVWTYLADEINLPNKKYPIAQSYVDVILTGCLEISEKFAIEFIKTTEAWNYPWINDRDNPRYPRALKDVKQKEKIDQLLDKYIGLEKRK